MKAKPDWNEIEGRIDFEQVNQKLVQFGASGAGRRKTAADLLDKVKDALLQGRSDGASYRALAAFLTESGLPVSEPTLRQYLNAHGGRKVRGASRTGVGRAPAQKLGTKRSARNSQPEREIPAGKAEPAAQGPQRSSPLASKAEAQPALEPWTPRPRGPHIADPSTL